MTYEFDVVHGHQQLSLFNAYYDEHCFLPVHVYDTERSRRVAGVLRPGKVPSGIEVRAHLRHPGSAHSQTLALDAYDVAGDSHYACSEAMAFCEQNGIDFAFGLAGTGPLARRDIGVCTLAALIWCDDRALPEGRRITPDRPAGPPMTVGNVRELGARARQFLSLGPVRV